MNGQPYRGGRIHVQADRCATCIFRPGAFQGLAPGRRAGMVLDAREKDSAIVCHETYNGPGAVCRGFFDLPRTTTPLALAAEMDLIVYDEAAG